MGWDAFVALFEYWKTAQELKCADVYAASVIVVLSPLVFFKPVAKSLGSASKFYIRHAVVGCKPFPLIVTRVPFDVG